MELVLWLLFLVPGFIYSIWRLTTRYDACPKCGSTSIVPLDTPVGAKLATDLGLPTEPPPNGAEQLGRSIGRMFAKK